MTTSRFEGCLPPLQAAESTRPTMDPEKEPPAEPYSPDIDSVQSLIKGLYIERKHDKWSRATHTSHNNNKPFKRKLIKKQKRKLSICYSSTQCKDILVKLESAPAKSPKDKDDSAMLKITEKMAKAWSEDGYREVISNLTVNGQSTDKNKITAQSSTNTANSSSEETEIHPQKSSQTCARQAMYDYCDSSVTELAAYLDEALFIPRKMSFMAEMMYT